MSPLSSDGPGPPPPAFQLRRPAGREAREQPGRSRTCSAGARSMAPAAGAGSSRCAQSRGPLSPWPPARSRQAPSAPHRRLDADSATPLAGEAALAQGGGGGGGRPGEGSSGTEAERGQKGRGAVGNGDVQGRGWPRIDPSGGGWRTAKAKSTAWLSASSHTPPKTIYLGGLDCLELGMPMFTLSGPQRLFRSQNLLGIV